MSTAAHAAASSRPRRRRRAAMVVVLGDVGRSPRMQYHCASLVRHGVHVTLVGYRGEACIAAVEESPLVHKALFTPPLSGPGWRWLKRRAYLVFGVFKALALALRLFLALLLSPVKPDFVLLQNPPAIPALAVAWLACRLRGCAYVIDWHNLGFTMLPHRDGHPVRRLARAYEHLFARGADAHFCVSEAMQQWLQRNFKVEGGVILYDRPTDAFAPTPPAKAHEIFLRLEPQLQLGPAVMPNQAGPKGSGSADSSRRSEDSGVSQRVGREKGPAANGTEATGQPEVTPFTRRRRLPSGVDVVELLPLRPALLVSSTSWTPDEDFGLLLKALVLLDRAWSREGGAAGGGGAADAADIEVDVAAGGGGGPSGASNASARGGSSGCGGVPIGGKSSDTGAGESAKQANMAAIRAVVVVTGKGPQRRAYERRLAELQLRQVVVVTAWLEARDYPTLLGSADLGVCLHTSTSGVDLPMKVVDMFGSGVPVCAVGFPALPELVQHGRNGLVFSTGQELATQLQVLLAAFAPSTADAAAREVGGNSSSSNNNSGSAAESDLHRLRAGASAIGRWDPNWDACAWPVLERCVGRPGLSSPAMLALAAAALVVAVLLLALDLL